MDLLLAEDLLLLLLDDDKGTTPSGVDVDGALGGAVLAELALTEKVEVEATGVWKRRLVYPVDVASAPADPVLAASLATIAEKPRSAQDLVGRLGKGLKEHLGERLAERGLVERREGKVLGLFSRTTWPAADAAHEDAVRQALTGVLVQGLTPDPRTAALVALLSALDRPHKTVDHDGVPARDVKRRAKELAEGDWAAKAVRDAIAATTAAVTAATVAATSAATAGS